MQCIHYLTAAGFIFLDKIPCNHKLSDNKYSWMITFTHFYIYIFSKTLVEEYSHVYSEAIIVI